MANQTPSDRERSDAYRKANRASNLLDEAAQELGYTDIHDLANVARDDDLPEGVPDGAVEALSTSHSWLNNGMIETMHPNYEGP